MPPTADGAHVPEFTHLKRATALVEQEAHVRFGHLGRPTATSILLSWPLAAALGALINGMRCKVAMLAQLQLAGSSSEYLVV